MKLPSAPLYLYILDPPRQISLTDKSSIPSLADELAIAVCAARVRHTNDLSLRLLPPLLRCVEGMLVDWYYFNYSLVTADDAVNVIRWVVDELMR